MSSIRHLWSHFGSWPRQEAVFVFLILRQSLGTAWRQRSIVTSRCAVKTVHHGDERCGSRLLGPVDIVALSRNKRWSQAEAVTTGTVVDILALAPSPHAARLRKGVDPRRVRQARGSLLDQRTTRSAARHDTGRGNGQSHRVGVSTSLELTPTSQPSGEHRHRRRPRPTAGQLSRDPAHHRHIRTVGSSNPFVGNKEPSTTGRHRPEHRTAFWVKSRQDWSVRAGTPKMARGHLLDEQSTGAGERSMR
jgi:hypothetical protein